MSRRLLEHLYFISYLETHTGYILYFKPLKTRVKVNVLLSFNCKFFHQNIMNYHKEKCKNKKGHSHLLQMSNTTRQKLTNVSYLTVTIP